MFLSRDSVAGKGFILRWRGNHVVFLELRRDSRVTTGYSGCLLCWPREVRSSIRVAKESWGLLSSDCRANRPHLGLCPEAHVPLQGRPGFGVAFQTPPGRQAFISSGSKEPRSALESRRVSLDRKSTRLNSSHQLISYAVFCLKKKKKRSSGGRKRVTKEKSRPGGRGHH